MPRDKDIHINVGNVELKGLSDAMSNRVPITIHGPEEEYKGFFTPESIVPDKQSIRTALEGLKAKHPDMAAEIDKLKSASVPRITSINWSPITEILEVNGLVDADEEQQKSFVQGYWKNILKNLGFSESMASGTEQKDSFASFMRDLTDTMYPIGKVYRQFTGKDATMNSKSGTNIDMRNAAMSSISDLLGKPGLVATAHKATVNVGGKEVKGTFMKFAEGYGMHSKDLGPLENYEKDVYDNPAVFEDIAAMQAIDYICGNLDRHPGNYHMQFGKVNGEDKLIGITLIDNDFAFTSIVPKTDDQRMSPDCVSLNDMGVIGEETANMIMKLTKKDIQRALKGYGLSSAEINAAWKRAQQLQDKIKWGKTHYDELEHKPVGELDKGRLRVVKKDEWRHYSLDTIASVGFNKFRDLTRVKEYIQERKTVLRHEATQKDRENQFYEKRFGVKKEQQAGADVFIEGNYTENSHIPSPPDNARKLEESGVKAEKDQTAEREQTLREAEELSKDGNAAGAQERISELYRTERNKSLQLNQVKDLIEQIREEAIENLRQLEGMRKAGHTNGPDYNKMHDELKALSEMGPNNASVNGVKKALRRLNDASRDYQDSHTGWFVARPGYGRNRRNMSISLQAFTKAKLNALTDISQGLNNNVVVSKIIGMKQDNLSKIEEKKPIRVMNGDEMNAALLGEEKEHVNYSELRKGTMQRNGSKTYVNEL